ncbi:MAG: glycosyl hydrolase [Ignavibacteriales bacterium]|nr:glycosyl hydrolase [Ignavibacteriales bacterium]
MHKLSQAIVSKPFNIIICIYISDRWSVWVFHFCKLFIVIILLYIFPGCKDKSTENDGNNEIPINKSPKRGIAFDLTSTADMASLSKGVSWWYNWYLIPNSKVPAKYNQTYGMDFIPMLWGGNPSNTDLIIIKNFILSHSEVQYLLVMNEPNLTNQANRTPIQAATDWLKYEQIVSDLSAQGRTVYLVGPAMNWGTMPNYQDPIVWLDAFYSAYRTANGGRDPKIDYLAFHWYDYGLSSQLDRLKKYDKQIWITEMANWNSQINSYAKQAVQMQEMVNICETRTDVFRYAWFYGRGSFPDNHFSYLFTSKDGDLSEIGQLYINLPYTK